MTESERARRVTAGFPPGTGRPPNPSLCDKCVEILRVEGAGVSIMSGRNSGPVCSSSVRVRQLEDLQFSLGEGPCHDAYTTGLMVAQPELTASSNISWPNYTPPALELGACAVFAFPLQIGDGIVGVLTLYNDTIGLLTKDQNADVKVLTRLLPSLMTDLQSRTPEQYLVGELSDVHAHRAEVHQASGITAVQLGVDADDALVRIRAHAYVTGQTVAHIANEILTHRLHLGNNAQDDTEPPHE